MEIKEVFIGRARKYNHFTDQGEEIAGHACANCVRRQFSFPWTCDNGWPVGDPQWVDRGSRCLNWTDKGDAAVD